MTQYSNRTLARSPKRKRQMDTTTRVLLIAFAVVGIILAIVAGRFIYKMVGATPSNVLPGAPIDTGSSNTGGTVNGGSGQSLQSSNTVSAKNWDGKSRVNILLLGLDYTAKREIAEPGPRFTDSMILVTVDPLSRTIGAMSIRRDLWVNVPGYDYNKINKAYWLGEAYNLPGLGPGLAMKTVEEFLGVPIDFYAQVDFNSFIRLIDEIDGVKVTLTERMLADWNHTGNKFWLEPGTYTMKGAAALAYARERKTEGDDVTRGSRQMEIITSIRNRILDFNMMPTLISRAPTIYQEVASGVQTNMTFEDL